MSILLKKQLILLQKYCLITYRLKPLTFKKKCKEKGIKIRDHYCVRNCLDKNAKKKISPDPSGQEKAERRRL